MRREREQAVLAEARIRESILRKERGLAWRYEGRDQDFARLRRWRKEHGDQLVVGSTGGGG